MDAGNWLGALRSAAAGNHPSVAALVYIAGYAPDKGESLGTLIGEAPADVPAPPILPHQAVLVPAHHQRPDDPAGPAVFVSRPAVVAQLIRQAANAAG